MQVRGCWVLLVGDYHYSDIKVVRGSDEAAARYYPTLGRMPTPLYQVGHLSPIDGCAAATNVCTHR